MGARPFLDFLREHRNGLTHDELTDSLNELVAAVAETEKGGKISITFAVKPNGDGAVMVLDEVKVTKPKPTKGGSLFFITPENNLTRMDPKQPQLPLRDIGPAREVQALPASAARALA